MADPLYMIVCLQNTFIMYVVMYTSTFTYAHLGNKQKKFLFYTNWNQKNIYFNKKKTRRLIKQTTLFETKSKNKSL